MTISVTHPIHNTMSGSLLSFGQDGYDQARLGWNRTVDQYPALILLASKVEDIIAGVRYARDAGLGVAVQSTGHGLKYPADDSLLVVTSRMSGVQVDPLRRVARVEAGVRWNQVLDQTTPYGLAPLLGSSPHVGVIGYSLGGGFGWLARRYGLAADSVRAVDLVTADGTLRHASADENTDLFWGLRGGGGNFGVVTGIEFSLYPVAKVYGGSLVYPAELAGEALRFYRDWVSTAPDELTSSITILKFPSLPHMPTSIRSKVQVLVRAAFIGPAEEGRGHIQPWLDWRPPVENTFRELPFAEIGTISNDPVDPTPAHPSHEMLETLSDAAIDVIVRRATASSSPLIYNELRHAGGAIPRADASASAIGNRDAQFYLQIGGSIFTPEMKPAIETYIRDYKTELRPYLHGGVYLNFLGGSEARERIQDAYTPESYRQLVALKAKYDPDNMFRFSYPLV